MTDNKQRFSKRVEDYIRYRPGYPGELGPRLLEAAGLSAGDVVAAVRIGQKCL